IECRGETLSTIQIGDGTPAFEDGDDYVDVTLAAGETVTCEFENTALGSIQVVKNTLGGDGSFMFSSPELGGFQLDTTGNTANTTFSNLLPGDYMIGEMVPPVGWDLTDLSCIGETGTTYSYTNPSVTVTLADGDNIICTFTNTERATLTLVKNLPNDNGGTATPADFQAYIDLSMVDWNTPVEIFPNTQYTASEDTLTGYAPGDWFNACAADGTVTALPGEDLTCEITNDDIAPQLTLVKSVTNNNGGNAQPDDFLLTVGGASVLSGVANAYDANTPLAINETQLTGYTFVSITGDPKCPAALGETVTLAPGDDITCTITNDDVAPQLTLIKSVSNNNGGNAQPDDFLLTVGGASVLSGVANAYDANTPLAINETQLPGYTFVSIAGDAKCPGVLGGTVTLDEGDDITCTITNDDIAPQLTLIKDPTNDDGGTAQPDDFQLTVGGLAVLSGVPTVVVSNAALTINETQLPGYAFVSITGDPKCPAVLGGTVTLDEGDDITCTITNDDTEATLTLIKDPTNDNGGNALPDDFLLTVGGASVQSGVAGAFTANTPLVINETQLTGYTFVSITGDAKCPAVLGGTVTLEPGDNITCTITNDDIAPQLTLIKDPTNDDGGTAAPDDFLLTVGGAGVLSGVANAYAANTPLAINETLLDGYTFVSIAGDPKCPAVLGGTVTLDEGDNIICTITNDDIPPAINLAKTVNGGATLEADGTYTVVYTITATNTGGTGSYDVVDAFSPGDGITLNTATAVYVAGTENSQTGSTAAYPNFVANEGLATGLNESWTVTANFTVDPAGLVPATASCDPGAPVINTGFYNAVSGSATDVDPTDNDTCTGLGDPIINLAKTVNGGATLELDGSYTVVYTITATNSGGPGSYDVVDAFSPGTGIALNTATAVYLAGSEDSQTGSTAAYPNFVTDEGLAAGLNESWTVTANFTVDPATLDPATASCDPGTPVINTGFYNAVSGSATDVDPTDNDTCTGLGDPIINLAKTATDAVSVGGDVWEVVYTITATNTGDGPGVYDLADTMSPGTGITPIVDASYPALAYVGGEVQTGTLTPPPLVNGDTWVTLEGLEAQASESWTITARFTVDVPTLQSSPGNADCDLLDGEQGTGFFNYVEGSATDIDFSDNEACVPYLLPSVAVPSNNPLALFLLTMLLLATGWYFRPAAMRRF
ncbi:MAG: hypothetical protein WBS20_01180, partial [Lysobacterales bacterium]